MKNGNEMLFVVGAAALVFFLMSKQKAAAAPSKLVKLPTNFNTLTPAQQTQYLQMLQQAQSVDGSIYE